MNHKDILGRPIEVGMHVVYMHYSHLETGFVKKLTAKRVIIVPKIDPQYTGNTIRPDFVVVVARP